MQKLFRLTDTVVFCFDGDNAGRKAAMALENTLPVLADGKNAVFLFLPDGEDPDDYVRKRGRAAFEKARSRPCRCPNSCLPSCPRGIRQRRPRAALVAAARPHFAEINAPVLAAILRRRLSELSGLPESDLRGLLNLPGPPGTSGQAPRAARDDNRQAPRGASFRSNVRRPPSLTRELIQGLLLQPILARSLEFPRPDDGSPDSAALVALVDHCATAAGELSAAGVLQHFAGSPHEAFWRASSKAEDHALTLEMTEANVRKGLENWWQQARRRAPPPCACRWRPDGREIQRLRQLDYVRQTARGPGTNPSEDTF